MAMYVEDWLATYGSPYLVAPDDQAVPEVELMEDGDQFRVHRSDVRKGPHQALAFVDGVRRGEAALYQVDAASGQVTRGVAGSPACGGGGGPGAGRPPLPPPGGHKHGVPGFRPGRGGARGPGGRARP